MRPGYFNKFSSAPIGLLGSGMGSKTKLLANSDGCFDGSGGGFIFGLDLFELKKEVSKSAPDGFVEVPPQRIVTKEFNCHVRCADKWPQNPGELRTQEQITGEPG